MPHSLPKLLPGGCRYIAPCFHFPKYPLGLRYLDQCGKGFESRLMNTIARLSIASAPDPAKIIADAAADPANPTAASWARPGDGGESTARERAREAREQSHVERSLLEFVKDLVGSFLADSFGLPSFSKVLRVFVMTGFPVAARCDWVIVCLCLYRRGP